MNKNLKTALKSLSKQRRKIAIKRIENFRLVKSWVSLRGYLKFKSRWSKNDLCGKMLNGEVKC